MGYSQISVANFTASVPVKDILKID